MDDNSLSIDLKKIRKNLPPPPVAVPPLNIVPVVQSPVVPKTPSMTTPMESKTPVTPPPRSMRRWLMLPAISLKSYAMMAGGVIIVLGIGYYIYTHVWTRSPFGPTSAEASEGVEPAEATASPEATEAELIERVGKLILLPSDETPTLAKVSDLSALEGQVFFKNASLGNIVLMYPKSLRAILYDPIKNKIIEIGPITTTSTSTTASN
jgi:hypothetical protein